jgi:hypothetical protein
LPHPSSPCPPPKVRTPASTWIPALRENRLRWGVWDSQIKLFQLRKGCLTKSKDLWQKTMDVSYEYIYIHGTHRKGNITVVWK